MRTTRRASYKAMETLLQAALNELAILAGEKMGPSDSTWQDIAGAAAGHLEALAMQLNAARTGNCESCITFPSPSEAITAQEQR